MAVFNKTKPVPEHEAEGEIEQIYYDIRQTLRITGVPQMFCLWAGYRRFLPLVWDALRPTAESRAFEAASDRLRAMAVRVAEPLGMIDQPGTVWEHLFIFLGGRRPYERPGEVRPPRAA